MGDEQPSREVELRHEATQCLVRLASGDQGAKDELFAMLYDELHDQASAYLNRENPGHTLQSTALVNEAWLRMIQQDKATLTSKGHFLAIAAKTMRRIMVDHARTKNRVKRGDNWRRVDLAEDFEQPDHERRYEDVLAVDHALGKLREKSERMAQIVELRFFGGLPREEVAEALGVSKATVAREWRVARALMSRLLGEEAGPEEPDSEDEA